VFLIVRDDIEISSRALNDLAHSEQEFSDMNFQGLLKASVLSEQLCVTEGTLAKWRLDGRGPCFVRVGRRIAYDPADVAAWLDARRVTSTSEVL
jgi:hypothetical protein